MLVAVLIVFGQRATAHDFSRSESTLQVDQTMVEAVLRVDLSGLPDVDLNGDARISYDELEPSLERIYGVIKRHFLVGGPAPPVQMTMERYDLLDGHVLQMQFRYRFEDDVQRVQVTSTLHEITEPDHRLLLSVISGGTVQQSILHSSMPTASFAVDDTSYAATARSFIRLGIEHIVTGYDHLAFLIALLVASTTLRSLVKVVTSFTLAHSITLALATFEVVVLPTRLTESIIALSIAYVALENVLGVRAVERHRITFIFGLVHGFGFSNVLRELHLPQGQLALSLFSFNAGVEIGQVVIVLIAALMVRYVAKSRWQMVRPAVSVCVICLGMYWFVQRALFG